MAMVDITGGMAVAPRGVAPLAGPPEEEGGAALGGAPAAAVDPGQLLVSCV